MFFKMEGKSRIVSWRKCYSSSYENASLHILIDKLSITDLPRVNVVLLANEIWAVLNQEHNNKPITAKTARCGPINSYPSNCQHYLFGGCIWIVAHYIIYLIVGLFAVRPKENGDSSITG